MTAEYSPSPPFAHWAGTRAPKILFVGEAHGRDEETLGGKPFVGEAGKELFRMMGEANPSLSPELHAEISQLTGYGLAWVKRREEWFDQAGVAFTNVLNFRPPENKIPNISLTRAQLKEQGLETNRPAITRALYIHPKYHPEVDRLWEEIDSAKPNLIVALGNTALWALTDATNISSVRGTISQTVRGHKLFPTYHPAGVLYNWSWRPIVIADLAKAFREGETSDIVRPARRIKIWPTRDDVISFENWCHQTKPKLIACDIETESRQITTIGFAPSPDTCFVIPLWDKRNPGWSYWSAEDEVLIWQIIKKLLEEHPIVGQNFVYDMQYIMKMGIMPLGVSDDTMLLHHSIFPEMQKGLGFLGSVYTGEPAWKLMRRRRATDVVKKDE